jgi:hypothetical protein
MAKFNEFEELVVCMSSIDQGLTLDREHQHIATFYEAKNPIFKLVFGHFEGDHDESIVISFYLDLNPALAVNWFHRVVSFYKDISLTTCFYIDDAGESYVEEEAEIIKSYKTEQMVLSKYLDKLDREDIKSFVDSKILGRVRETKKQYLDYHGALSEFNKMKKPVDDDECH